MLQVCKSQITSRLACSASLRSINKDITVRGYSGHEILGIPCIKITNLAVPTVEGSLYTLFLLKGNERVTKWNKRYSTPEKSAE